MNALANVLSWLSMDISCFDTLVRLTSWYRRLYHFHVYHPTMSRQLFDSCPSRRCGVTLRRQRLHACNYRCSRCSYKPPFVQQFGSCKRRDYTCRCHDSLYCWVILLIQIQPCFIWAAFRKQIVRLTFSPLGMYTTPRS